MKYVVFSDIHGNKEAFDTVLSDVRSRELMGELEDYRTICLGDIVGYMPYPNECIEFSLSIFNNCLYSLVAVGLLQSRTANVDGLIPNPFNV